MGLDSEKTMRILLTELIHIMDRKIRTVDDRLSDDEINFPTETTKIDRIMEITITKMELGEIMEIFLVRHQDKVRTFHKVILSADFSLSILEVRHLEDQTIIQPLIPLLMNKNFRNFRKVTINHQRAWFASSPLMIALTNYQDFVR